MAGFMITMGNLGDRIGRRKLLMIGATGFSVADLVVGSAPPARAGSAASLSETSAEFAFALGIAVLGSLGTAVYRGQIAGSTAASLGGDAAHESLAGAVAAAATLPAPFDALLLAAARDAFTSSMHVVAAASALVLLGVAVLALTCLRQIRPIGVPHLSEHTTSQRPVESPDLALA